MTTMELIERGIGHNCLADAYDLGRADKYQEITSEYMLLTEKQVAEIRTDAIDDFLDWLLIDHYVRDAHMWDMEKEEILKEFKEQNIK